MKIFACFALLLTSFTNAQPNTEVFVLDLIKTDSTFSSTYLKNISNNIGYDNQPSFLDSNSVLFAGSENGQSEIQLYYITENTKHRINAATPGGEYSPKLMPDGKHVAAVRLDTTGLQRLYSYDFTNPNHGDNKMLLSELEIAYYAFYNEDYVVASILSGNTLDLVIANIPRDEARLYAENVGRSIHNVPNTSTVSYTVINEEKNHDVYVVDVMRPEDTYFVCQLPVGVQDHAWLDATSLIIGSGSRLYIYDLFGPGEWKEIANLSTYAIDTITRIAVSPDGKHIALAAENKAK